MPLRFRKLLLFVLALTLLTNAYSEQTADHRAWQHGVNLLQVGNRLLVVWGSAGNPPEPKLGGNWPHDIYYAWLNSAGLNAAAALDVTTIVPRTLISLPEAQEPPSVAINSRGTIMVTSEDGNDGINQHAGLWDSELRVLRKYPFTIKHGGHSGHVAAMQDRFLVTYSEGWVNGDGWLNLGTGKQVFAKIVGNDGKRGREIRLTPDRETHPRNSWPLVAGSDRNWLVVWQKFPELTLQSALVDRSGVVVNRNQIIGGLPLRYAYDVEFVPQLASFVVTGSSGDGGFVSLINLAGHVVRIRDGLPPMASESRLVLSRDGEQLIGVYPVSPRGIAVVRLSAEKIDLVEIIDHPHIWDYSGTAGMFVAQTRVIFVTLSTAGLQLIPIEVPRR